MKTFILFWNPAISDVKPEDWQKMIDREDIFDCSWAVWDHDQADDAGERFFMVRCGEGNMGICQSGRFCSKPYQGEDWAGTEKQRYYMDMDCYDCVPADEQPPISVDVLEKAIPDIDWRRGHSGQLLSEEDAMKLDELWNGMMSKE